MPERKILVFVRTLNRDSVGSHGHRGIELQVITKREGARIWKPNPIFSYRLSLLRCSDRR